MILIILLTYFLLVTSYVVYAPSIDYIEETSEVLLWYNNLKHNNSNNNHSNRKNIVLWKTK